MEIFKSSLRLVVLLVGVTLLQSEATQPIDPSLWPDFSGEWQFLVLEPSSIQGQGFTVPICQNGPELVSWFADALLDGLINLDGTANIWYDFTIGRRTVWIVMGNLNSEVLEGYYKPEQNEAFFPVQLKAQRLPRGTLIDPKQKDLICPPGFKY